MYILIHIYHVMNHKGNWLGKFVLKKLDEQRKIG